MAHTESGQTPDAAIEKRISLKTRGGERVSLDVTLADANGRQSALEYLEHLDETIRRKLGDTPVFAGFTAPNPYDHARIEAMIVNIASFHDATFGTFNQRTTLPEDERNEFVEIFLLACASVVEGRQIVIDLSRGRVDRDRSLD
ncbi:hypothetical protein [Acidihalobacter prosperus]|uniref:Uncharacterized protein n=1 Tax=Acidihalobacter prosperus TaxID=160660 RepID=A0A1A6C5P4_9GAMM|nr:hypothetical protein [Acidihalobacter prosperus]OBS09865.1 hypothetical protein Thpro_020915 [Acidihalobacter prosperus]